jgi:hypothetical protein
MDVSLEIKKIQKDLELIHDENLINSIKSLLAFAKKQKQNIVYNPFSIEEYKKRAEQSEEDIKKGQFINIDDL